MKQLIDQDSFQKKTQITESIENKMRKNDFNLIFFSLFESTNPINSLVGQIFDTHAHIEHWYNYWNHVSSAIQDSFNPENKDVK